MRSQVSLGAVAQRLRLVDEALQRSGDEPRQQPDSAAGGPAGVPDHGGAGGDPTAEEVAGLLGSLVRRVGSTVGRPEVWLLLVALRGAFPTPAEVERTRRRLRLDPAEEVSRELLEDLLASPSVAAGPEMVLVLDRPVVDVDFTARHDHQTGVQRVVRQTVSRWARQESFVLAVWDDAGTALRELRPEEEDRVLRFRPGSRGDGGPASGAGDTRMVVPWRTGVVLPEVPRAAVADRLRALATANSVIAVGHDCIPVVSADTLPAVEAVKFVRYLSLLKHARLVVSVSEASGGEFSGFADMLLSQGLRGPDVVACPLPVEVPAPRRGSDPGATHGPPQVLAVGSHEPRKNHLAVLHAAERLWSEGNDFSLVFVGSRGWRSETFETEVRRLARAGRRVRTARGVADGELWELYRSSRFSVFPSLHEGYGLPVAESLASGVPVITSDRGSTAEIARGGGALTVDPLDDEALFVAMRRLLVDDSLIRSLRAQAAARPPRSWDDYAAELWGHVAEVTTRTTAEVAGAAPAGSTPGAVAGGAP